MSAKPVDCGMPCEHGFTVVERCDCGRGHWQDAALLVGQGIFIAALLPSVFSADKPHVLTCAMTAPVLLAFAVTFSTLGLRWAAVSAAISSTLWFVLLLQQLLGML